MQNHVIDPTYFYDCIEEFSFDYNIYVVEKKEIDASGNVKRTYSKNLIRGSLQSQGVELRQSKDGNTKEMRYNFYCKSLYRIDIGDIIEYKNRYLRVESVKDFDEYGVRECSLLMVQLTKYRDLADYIKYLQGEKLV